MSCHAPSPPTAILDEPPVKAGQPRGRFRTIALIGPPNSGKSTLFNRLTGLRQKVANYPGVTVEQRSGRMSGIRRHDLTLIDLPGVYSLTGYSEDARVAVDVLKGEMPGTPRPDAVLIVLDALNLSRQLMLAGPILALGLPTMVLLNMADLLESRGGLVDPLALAQELGRPVALISASTGHRHRCDRTLPATARQQSPRIRQDAARHPHRVAGPAESGRVPPLGVPGQQPHQVQGARRRRCGPAGSIPSCCTASGDHSSSLPSWSWSSRWSSPSASR